MGLRRRPQSSATSNNPAKRDKMPRPMKTARRQKVNAGLAWKRGDKKEAYKLWGKAAAAQKEHRAKKHNKNKGEPDEGAEPSKSSE